MSKRRFSWAAGAAALFLSGSLPAGAQMYDDGFDDPPPPPIHRRVHGGEAYGGYAPAYRGYGPGFNGYIPEDETLFVDGFAHRRCRPHKACYEDDGDAY